ncbi:MAG: ABC transporter ATP-binding protein, partial [Sphingomonadales bacterium]|nr:ABC transporter ATP-binding protein [Sphingomonadales bacterium]
RDPEDRKKSDRRDPEDRKSARQPDERKQARRNAAPAQPGGDLKRQLEQSALAVDKLSQALALIEKKLADPALYNQHADIIADWQRKHADVSKRLADAEDAWLRAQASVDRAGA